MAIIGIPSNHLNHPNPKHRTNYVDYTQQNYTAALREAGALPVVFPMGSPEEAAEYVNSVDAVLLIGGQDVGPLFYGEDPTPQMGETDRQRDLFELAIVAEARKQNKPLMGICRGAQLINVALGGTLIQDIDTQYTPENGNPIVKHDQFPVKWYEPTHRLDVLPDNFLTGTLGDNPIVNSFHHQGIKQLGTDLQPAAFASDGTVEAYQSSDASVRSVQYHPEMMFERDKTHLRVFQDFVDYVNAQK